MRILVKVLGCRSSLCEGEYIAGELINFGHEVTDDINLNYDNAVIVTCSVTSEADKKCRQLIRRARRLIGLNGVLAVCGCWSENINTESAKDLGINILAGSKHKNILPEILNNMILTGEKNFIDLRNLNINIHEWEELKISRPVMHSRAFIKIQDGCDHFCTYCVIPFLRGRPVSRPIENIISEIKILDSNGTREIILTGIHLGIYGREINTSLAELINKISGLNLKNISRLRLGSLEPFCLDEKLLIALKNCEIFCRHLHLPLQSGDDEILKSMRRGYNAGGFCRICENARKNLGDDLHISSDILTGFPGETDEAFSNTLKIMRKTELGRVHVFPYSERAGTIAEKLKNKVDNKIKSFRTSEAIKLGGELFKNYAEKFVNSDVEILAEKNSCGHAKNYIEAECVNKNLVENNIYNLRIINISSDGKFKCEHRD